MEPRTKIVSLKLEDGSVVKVQAVALGGDQDVAAGKVIFPIKILTDSIESITHTLLATLQKVKPDKATVEFGLEVAVESGALTALLAKGTGTGNLKITLEWEKGKSLPGVANN